MKLARFGFLALLAVYLVLPSAGCGVTPTENHKTLNALNQDAGDQLSRSIDPDVAQAGADVRENSKVLASTLIGTPEQQVKYTAELSAKVRAATIAEFQNNQPWYKKAAGTLLSVLSVLAIGGTLAARFFPATAPIMAIATPVIAALTEIKQKADAAPNDSIHIDALQPIISKLTLLPKIGPLIAAKLKDLHLDQLVHSPEAPDVPAAPVVTA